MNIEKHSGSTNFTGYTFSYTWIINNFNICNQTMGESIQSPSFYSSRYPDLNWNLIMYPRGDKNKQSEGHISLYLMLQTTDGSKVKAVFSISLVGQSRLKIEKQAVHTFNNESHSLGFPRFLNRDYLSNPTCLMLSGNQLTILCTITMEVQSENFANEIVDVFDRKKNKFLLSRQLQRFLKTKQLTDITLVASGNSLQAHKAVLAARSPVFLAMLQYDMKDTTIELAEINFDVLTDIVHYLYTDAVQNIKEHFRDFIRFADKYDIKGLKLLCEKYVYNELLTVKNAAEFLILAETHNCNILKSQVQKFICKNAKCISEAMKEDFPSSVVDMINARAFT